MFANMGANVEPKNGHISGSKPFPKMRIWSVAGRAGTGREGTGKDILYTKCVFISMVITRAQNGSPDMILTAFDRKFHEKKDEIPPRACNPSYIFIYPILEMWSWTWNPKMIINRRPGHPTWPEFGMHLPTISPKVFPCPKGPNFN